MRGQVQATEIPHQVPEDDGVLAEELVGVDHLEGQDREVRLDKGTNLSPHLVSHVVAVWEEVLYLISLVLQQGLQLLAQHQGAEVGHRHRLGVWPFSTHAILTNTNQTFSLHCGNSGLGYM